MKIYAVVAQGAELLGSFGFFLYSEKQKLRGHTLMKRKILRHGQKHKQDRRVQHISAQTSARHTVISPEV